MEQFIQDYLPWIIALVAGWIILGMMLKLAATVIRKGCGLIAVIIVILILISVF